MPKTFTCAECGETFNLEWSDEKAKEEASKLWSPSELANAAVICDECFKEFMGWMEEHPEVRQN